MRPGRQDGKDDAPCGHGLSGAAQRPARSVTYAWGDLKRSCSVRLTSLARNNKLRRMRYLALGDSYTIGEQVDPEQRWPSQLVSLLRQEGLHVDDAEIIARTGWTTRDLIAGIEGAAPGGRFDLVSLLIGVNNQYQGRDLEEYRSEFRGILARAVALTGGVPARVIVVSIPDWGATPFARGRNRARIADEIDRFNDVNRDEAERAGARYVDITGLSGLAGVPGGEALVVADGLHPAGAMYSEWARRILPQAVAALGRASR